jgi:hypothetical protein
MLDNKDIAALNYDDSLSRSVTAAFANLIQPYMSDGNVEMWG